MEIKCFNGRFHYRLKGQTIWSPNRGDANAQLLIKRDNLRPAV